MKKVTIKRPSKTNMQSGLKKTKMWIIEFDFDHSLQKDLLMGWNSSKNTTKQLKLNFDSLDDAILWCQKNSYKYRVVDQTYRLVKSKSYASNFSNNRKTSWTH